mgnify:FL=1
MRHLKKIVGLSKDEVKERKLKGLVNYDTTAPSKSVKQILFENTFTLFNFINIILAILIILVGSYRNLLFLGVVICNTLISSVQEIRAKKTVDKLSIIASSKAKVIRDGIKQEININDVVLDDIIIYELGNQIIADSKIIEGSCEVNESFITGESKTIYKKQGDMLLSGSFIVSGFVYSKVIHVGMDNYTSIISHDAKMMNKEVNSQIMKSLNRIVKYISITLIPIGILLLLKQFSLPSNTTQNAVVSVVAALIGMIPEGLILLVSTVLAISVLKLSKYNVLVQDLYSIETLARVDTLCLDKTGTITEGKMNIYDVVLAGSHKMEEIDSMMEALSTNLNDNNPTFIAINEKYGNNSPLKAIKTIPFSSEKKCSSVIFDDYSITIGAPEFILKEKEDEYKDKINELSEENRVLALIKTKDKKIDVLGFILIRDKIKDDAKDTLSFFMDNDVELKIISGDNPNTVSSVAKSVGIKIKGVYDARCINENTDINNIVEENNIFGRVKPEEKRLLIRALKNNGHVVAMTGDGVNDVLALKESDCGIAMNSLSDAARNVSELVLLDSNFEAMPKIVKEGRQSINNIERSATLFLSKTIYASLLAILFLFINYSYPFWPIQMTLINSLTIGIPAFILALEKNNERVKGKFLINVISKSIPSGITTVINILLLVFLSNIFNISEGQISTCAVIITGYTAILLIYRISKPLNLLRKALLFSLIFIFSLALITPIGREVFYLEFLSPNSLLILLPLMYLSTRLFVFLSRILNVIIKRKGNWFI